jgi:hypothetical protein
MARSKSTGKKKSSTKAAAGSDMPVDADLALTICAYYGMAFFIGMTQFTDQLAKGYGIEVSDKSKMFMKFAGANGFFAQVAANRIAARAGNNKTKSLTCLANMIAFGFIMTHQIIGQFFSDQSFSSKIGMDENMEYFNIAQGFVLCSVSYMGWVSSGSAMPSFSVPDFSGMSDQNKFNYATIATCLFFGVMSYYNTDALIEMYLPGQTITGSEGAMMTQLMKFMGMLLLGNAIRFEFQQQAGQSTVSYANLRATLFYYAICLGIFMFNGEAAKSIFGTTDEQMWPAKVADFVRVFGLFMWGTSIMVKQD